MKLKIVLVTALALTTQWICAQEGTTLSLEQCRTMALENNKKIKAAQYEVDASKQAAKAVNVSILPTFSSSLMGVHLGKPLSNLLPAQIGSGTVDVTQPVYVGGKIYNGRKAAAKAVEIYEGQKQLTEAEVLISVEKAYWQVVQVKEKIRLTEKYRDMLQSLHEDLKNSYNAGLIYKNDLLKVGVNLNETNFNLVKANDGLTLAKLNLAQMLGMANNSDFAVSDTIGDSYEMVSRPDQANVIDNRTEVKVLNKAIEVQKLQTKIIKADLLPTVALTASGMTSLGKKINMTNGKDQMYTYYAMASVKIPIFDWGKTSKKAREQSFKVKEQQVQLEETKELLNLEIQNAYMSLNQSVKKVELSKLSLQQADENLRLANDRFKAGTIVGKDVQEAQAIWQQAYSNLIDAKIEYRINQAAYKKEMGELH